MKPSLADRASALPITLEPNLHRRNALRLVWADMVRDPLWPLFWSDLAPQTYEDLAAALQATPFAWIIRVGFEPAGLFHVGATVVDAGSGRLLRGEPEAYLRPKFRGAMVLPCARAVLAHLEGLGVEQLLAFPQRRHRVSRLMLHRLGWHRIGAIPLYIPVGGQLYDAVLYSWKPPRSS